MRVCLSKSLFFPQRFMIGIAIDIGPVIGTGAFFGALCCGVWGVSGVGLERVGVGRGWKCGVEVGIVGKPPPPK